MPSAPISNLDSTAPTITIGTATGQRHTSSATATIDLPTLPAGRARSGHIMPAFTTNLLSIGTFCDAECTAIFTRFWVTIRDRAGNTILQGPREEHGSRLWRINLRAHDNPVRPAEHEFCHHAHSASPTDCMPTVVA